MTEHRCIFHLSCKSEGCPHKEDHEPSETCDPDWCEYGVGEPVMCATYLDGEQE